MILIAAFCVELPATEDYTDYLKNHVDRKVFRDWTTDEIKGLLLEDIPVFDENYLLLKLIQFFLLHSYQELVVSTKEVVDLAELSLLLV